MRAIVTGWKLLDLCRRLDPDEVRERQERSLLALVEHAVRTVPFWQERFQDAGLVAADIRRLEDLTKIPVVRKEELRAADPAALLSSEFPVESLVAEHTMGSTSRPFTVRFTAVMPEPRTASSAPELRGRPSWGILNWMGPARASTTTTSS